VTLSLELGGIQNPDILRAFEQVSVQFPLRGSSLANDVLFLAATGTVRKLDFGSNSVVFTANQDSAVKTVSHGLGVVPQAVIATATGSAMFIRSQALTTTTFDVVGHQRGAVTETDFFYWVAIG
jgi:hypothetical protein